MSHAYEAITARILDMLFQGQIPWRRPWRAIKGSGMQHPRNISGNLYRGANWFLLGMLSYPNPVFLTYRQAQALGGHIRKGEHGFPVVFWKLLEITPAICSGWTPFCTSAERNRSKLVSGFLKPSGNGTCTKFGHSQPIHFFRRGMPPASCAPSVRPWKAFSNETMIRFCEPCFSSA